jgi:hypothetical protein
MFHMNGIDVKRICSFITHIQFLDEWTSIIYFSETRYLSSISDPLRVPYDYGFQVYDAV